MPPPPSTSTSTPLRVGFVPEHFSTPLHFAAKHFSLSSTLVPFPSGTGHMITALRAGELDIGIGLTEGWVAGLGAHRDAGADGGYRIVGTYVETPLCWAISTGAKRDDIKGVRDLKGGRIGVSRVGSGSYVMGFVLADEQGWLSSSASASGEKREERQEGPFEVIPLQTFEKLREGVNGGVADFFMWEHFTSKRYYDKGEIKRAGEIYTPWSSWLIVAATDLLTALDGETGTRTGTEVDPRMEEFFEKLDRGTKHFLEHQEEAVEYISTELDYSAEDAREWLKTVKFASSVQGVDLGIIKKTVDVLRKAGVLGKEGMHAEEMIGGQPRAQRPATVHNVP